MSLDSFNVVRPNAKLGGADPLELIIEEFGGMVEGTLQRRSVTEGMINIKQVKGTATVSNYAIGATKLQVIEPGKTPNGTSAQFSKNSVTVDRTILARAILPLLDVFQTQYDARKEIALEHGKRIAKFKDQSFLIQAIKTARLTVNPYGSLEGHAAGTVVKLTAAGDATDPAKLYHAFGQLFAQMMEKDVDPTGDDVWVFMRPATFYALQEAEQVINGEYVTSDGTNIKAHIYSAWGVPVVPTPNMPNWVEGATERPDGVAAHMGDDYAGDFTKVVAVAFSTRALLAGSTIDLDSKVFFDDVSKHWYVDSWLAYASAPNRAEFAGTIELP
ncbi:putative capsid protein [Pseudomonas phage BIM BV-45]|nr:putative capsid protein [Pseudomonas phage BIM BV-45]